LIRFISEPAARETALLSDDVDVFSRMAAACGLKLPPMLCRPNCITVADARVKGLWKDVPLFVNELASLSWR
jgi:hypothetical protein